MRLALRLAVVWAFVLATTSPAVAKPKPATGGYALFLYVCVSHVDDLNMAVHRARADDGISFEQGPEGVMFGGHPSIPALVTISPGRSCEVTYAPGTPGKLTSWDGFRQHLTKSLGRKKVEVLGVSPAAPTGSGGAIMFKFRAIEFEAAYILHGSGGPVSYTLTLK